MEINGLNEEIWHYPGAFLGFVLKIKEAVENRENFIHIILPDINSFNRLKEHLETLIENLKDNYAIQPFENGKMCLIKFIQSN